MPSSLEFHKRILFYGNIILYRDQGCWALCHNTNWHRCLWRDARLNPLLNQGWAALRPHVDYIIFHPNDPLFQNGCGWNDKLHSLSTRPVAMIYFRTVWSPQKVDLLDWQTFWTYPPRALDLTLLKSCHLGPFSGKKGPFADPNCYGPDFQSPPPPPKIKHSQWAFLRWKHSRPTELDVCTL